MHDAVVGGPATAGGRGRRRSPLAAHESSGLPWLPMVRTRLWTLVLALAAMLVTALFAVAAYRVVERAFRAEYGARLEQLALLAASQVNPADLTEAQRIGEESAGFLALQALLDPFVVGTGLADATVVDSAGIVIYDVREPELTVGLPSELDTLAAAELRGAKAGRRAVVSTHAPGRPERWLAFAPVRREAGVVGVLVLQGEPAFAPTLQRLRRTLAVAAFVSLIAIAALAMLLVRTANSGLALERRLSRAENLAAMGRLTATLAHEIKNPLAILRGTAKRLGRNEPAQQPLADSMIEEVDRLARTVNRYLQFARGESPSGETGDLTAALGATLDLLEGEFQSRNVELRRELAAGEAVVVLDEESLKQVFLNLVLNALEASPAGAGVRVVSRRERDRAEVIVEDEGPGVPADVIERLGEPFLTTKAQGTGLGLFLSQRLLQGAGGVLAVRNRPGAGAEIRVSLPFAGTGSAAETRR